MASRTPKTDAYKVFEANLERSRAFLRIFSNDGKGRSRGHPSNDEKELLRGTLVFAVGALDAYLSDLILEIVPTFGPTSPNLKTALREIAKSDPSLPLRVALADGSGREEFRRALEEWLETKSFQGVEKVVAALSYVGCTIQWADFDAVTGVSTAAELARITDERHDIVHRGEKPYVRQQLAEEAVKPIDGMAALIDRSVCDRYGKSLRVGP